MNIFRYKLVRILSSIIVGIVGFCLAALLIGNLGAIFVTEHGHAFFSQQEAVLFLMSILLGLIVAIVIGIKFHRYLSNRK